MHKTDKLNENGTVEKVLYRRQKRLGNVEGKTIGKKGYFESADELLSLRNNLFSKEQQRK